MDSPISTEWRYKKTGHACHNTQQNPEYVDSEFWVLCANTETYKFMYYSVACGSLRGELWKQIMAELPFDLKSNPLLLNAGLICLGLSLYAAIEKN